MQTIKPQGASWQALIRHGESMQGKHLADMFAQDSQRFETLHRQWGPILFDFSKQRIEMETLDRLLD